MKNHLRSSFARAMRFGPGSRIGESAAHLRRLFGAACAGSPADLELSQARFSQARFSQATLSQGLAALLDAVPGLGAASPAKGAQALGQAPGEFRAASFAGRAGSRAYRLYIPRKRAAHAGLIVMLHGCTQTAEDFAAGTRMNLLAEQHGFLVLYPVQPASANPQRCWNWFNTAEQQRDHGEPAIIADMTRGIIADHAIASGSVYAAGLSAGGAEAAILGARYPELFAAIGVHSGLACGAAGDMTTAFAAMHQGRPGQGAGKTPVIIFHGDRDHTVNQKNADEIAAQFGASGPGESMQGTASGGQSYTRTLHRAQGRIQVEQWRLHGAGHAWSGGDPAGSYTDPAGPDASGEMVRFFNLEGEEALLF
jgi:poly(hydroxyalkanoate) depolymerase family esterase